MIFRVEKILNHWWGMLIIISLPIFVVLSPMIIFGRYAGEPDFLNFLYPGWYFFKTSIMQGQIPLWNPNNFGGFLAFLSMSFNGIWSPLNYLFFGLLPVNFAYGWLIFIHLTAAAFFTSRLLKKFNLSVWAQVSGGLVYVFSQWYYGFSYPFAQAIAFLPIIFLAVWNLRERGRRWAVVLGALAIGWFLPLSFFQYTVEAMAAGGGLAILLAIYKREYIRVVLKYVLAGVVSLGLAIVPLMPLLAYLQLSSRASFIATYHQWTGSALNLTDLANLVVPYIHSAFGEAESQIYFGVLPLFLVIAIWFLKSRMVKIFSILMAVSIFIALPYSPLYWLMTKLPLFSMFTHATRWLFIFSFTAAILTAIGLDYIGNIEKRKWSRVLGIMKLLKWLGVVYAVIAVIITIIIHFAYKKFINLAFYYFDAYYYPQTSGLPKEFYHNYLIKNFDRTSSIFDLFNVGVLSGIIFIFISIWWLKKYFSGQLTSENFKKGATLIIVLNLVLVYLPFHKYIKAEIVNRESQTVKFLQNHPGRYFPLMYLETADQKLNVPQEASPTEKFIFESEFLPANVNLFYNLETIALFDALMSKNMAETLGYIGYEGAMTADRMIFYKITNQEKLALFAEREKILDFLGVKYVVTGFELEPQTFTKVFETTVPPKNIPVYIFENKDELPLFYFASRVEHPPAGSADMTKILPALAEELKFYIECHNCDEAAGDGKGQIKIIKKSNERIELGVEVKNSTWLVHSQNLLPGWRATIDGQPVKIYRVNGLFMAVLIPAGRHEVVFQFRYPGFNLLAK